MGFALYKIIIKKLLNPAICVLTLTACSGDDSLTSASQVIAKVNGDEITANQLNVELGKIKSKVSDKTQLSQKILIGLIDRQLLVQEASKLNLDRSLEVQEAVASAKAQIYAQAYIARKLTKLPSTTEQDIKQFVDEHPHYFSQRFVFHTLDFIFENHPDKLNLHWLESEIKTVDALYAALNEKGVPFNTVNTQFSTDGLPQQLLDKVKGVKVGDLLFAHDDNKVVVKTVSSIEPSPVPTSQIEQIAAQMLSEQQKQNFIAKEINRLKSLAKVEILDSNLIPKQTN